MNSEEIQERLEVSRERMLVALELLPDEALLEKGAAGDWSIKDLLAHLAVWESELITALMRLDQGKKPTRLLESIRNVDAYNAQIYEENKERDLDRVFDDFHGTRVQLERWLAEFSRKDLTDPQRFPALAGDPLWKFIAANSFEHEEEHLPAVEDFAAQWQGRAEEG